MELKNILGDYLDTKEDMYNEYKEFCFKENIYNYFTKQQINAIIYDGKLPNKFDHIVIINIRKYIDIYLSKYVSSFHNCKTKSKDAMDFIIGINDDAEITGIPYSGDMIDLQNHLSTYTANHLLKNVNDRCCLDVNIEIHKCDIKMELLDDTYVTDQIIKQRTILNYYNILNRKYNKKRKQWIKKIMKYKGKLSTALNDETFLEEFIDHMKSIDKYKEFENDITIGYEFDQDSVKHFKENDKHFMFWLIKYKDLKANELMMKKPKAPCIQKIPNIEMCACTQLSMLRHRLLFNNSKLNYYIIKIIVKQNNNCIHKIHFMDHRQNNWRTVKRCLNENETDPYCHDI